MPVSEGYKEYVMRRLERVGQVTARNMFGGVGIYFEGLFCALIAEDVLYFKVDDVNRVDYEAAGMGPFRSGGQTMRFYQMPEEVLDNDEELQLWMGKALDVARRKLAEKRERRKRGRRKKVIRYKDSRGVWAVVSRRYRLLELNT